MLAYFLLSRGFLINHVRYIMRQSVGTVVYGSVSVSKKKEEVKEEKKELGNCPRCGRKMSWFENEDGTIGQWCYYDQVHLLDPKLDFFK
jgi:hypothetical protein